MASYGTVAPASRGKTRVCSISFNMDDRLRLIALPPEMTSEIRAAIESGWGPIQEEREYHGTHEFKLRGNPWSGTAAEGVKSRRLLASILQKMAMNGWSLLQAADVSKKPDDKDTLFFEHGNVDPEAQLFAMSLNRWNRIRLIDASNVMPYVKEAVSTQWSWGIKHEIEYHGSLELKLHGSPWFPDGSETVFGRLLLCQIIANIREAGYKLYGSIDISSASGDLESWIFRRVTPFWQ